MTLPPVVSDAEKFVGQTCPRCGNYGKAPEHGRMRCGRCGCEWDR